MCGSTNSGVIRGVRSYIAETGRSKKTIFSIGDKGTVGMQRPFPDLLKVGISEVQTPYNYPTVMAITEHVMKAAESSEKITMFYNEYVSAISANIRRLELLPR
jgi:F-type H+-transporting ATPase subunit gamma